MNISDILMSSGDELDVVDNNMDSLNYDPSDLMSSEFFDSVLSLENNLEHDLANTAGEEFSFSSDTSSHTDELLSPRSIYSDNEKCSPYNDSTDETSSLLSNTDGINDPLIMSFLDSLTDNQQNETFAPVISQKPTKIIIQNPTNKKIITKPILHTGYIKKNMKPKTQILKVQTIGNNGKPILLPLSVKSIKFLNTANEVTSVTNNVKTHNIEQVFSVKEEPKNNSSDNYPPLSLTAEEKRLLAKEGIQLPTHYPLTKNEERELKRIRRKIRNKISAQDSRKRKKEYIDGLEERVKRGSEENKNLLHRVRELQRQNKTLIAHVSKLQALICNSTSSKATPSTCLMVVLLSALLVSLPNIRMFEKNQLSSDEEQVAIGRSLLSNQQVDDDSLNMEEFLVFKDEDPEFVNKFLNEAYTENATDKDFSKLLESMGNRYKEYVDKNNSEKHSAFDKLIENIQSLINKCKPQWFANSDYGGYHNKKGFIEPDIDDSDSILRIKNVEGGPPSKKMRYIVDDNHYKYDEYVPVLSPNENVISATLNTHAFGIKDSKDK